ncbi:MAG TPA: hypothetical protein VMV12_04910, partial [Candidatus Micrarchaeaceae archaeon]|nr:hypothetical protein [Candidatus Micrarchaeaceae archaeon]
MKAGGLRSGGRALGLWLLVALSYAPLAAIAYMPSWLNWSAQMNGTNTWDRNLEEWFIAWVPFAVSHGHDLFITGWQFVPGGVNLMWNASEILIALVGAPLTMAVGVADSYSILATLALAVSGASMFMLLRRWVSWTPAAWIGGLLYGFSPYLVAEGLGGRLHLLTVAAPPLIVLLVDRLWSDRECSGRRAGLGLGLLAAAEFFTAEETIAIAAVFIAIGLVIATLANREQARSALPRLLAAGAWAAGTFAVIAGYPVFVQFFGPYVVHGSVQAPTQLALFSADLTSPLIPGVNQLLGTAGLDQISNHFAFNNPPEVTTYVGIPLLVLLLIGGVVLRRERRILLLLAIAGIGFVLALGPHLIVLNKVYFLVHMPEAVLAHMPLFGNAIPSRYALGMWLSLAGALALVIDRLHGALLAGRGRPLAVVAGLGVALVALVPLIPNWPYPEVSAQVPAFFTTRAVDVVPANSVAVVYPVPRAPYDQALLWQSDANMRFKQPGGYATAPTSTGAATAFAFPDDVQNCLDQLYATGKVPAGLCQAAALIPSLRALSARTIVIPRDQLYAAIAKEAITRALQERPRLDRGVWLWSCSAQSNASWCRTSAATA